MRDVLDYTAVLHHSDRMLVVLVAVFCFNNYFLFDKQSPDGLVYMMASDQLVFS